MRRTQTAPVTDFRSVPRITFGQIGRHIKVQQNSTNPSSGNLAETYQADAVKLIWPSREVTGFRVFSGQLTQETEDITR